MGVSGDAQITGSAEDAFEEFVRGRSTHLFRLALVLTGWDKAAAEDVLQIALERAYRRRRLLFRQGSAEPYVRRVIVNAAIDWRRLRRRRAEQPLDLAAGLAVEDRTGQVGDRDVLVRALAALAPKLITGSEVFPARLSDEPELAVEDTACFLRNGQARDEEIRNEGTGAPTGPSAWLRIWREAEHLIRVELWPAVEAVAEELRSSERDLSHADVGLGRLRLRPAGPALMQVIVRAVVSWVTVIHR